MAKKITIPITNHEEDSICTMYYRVSYKLNTEVSYIQLPPMYGDSLEILNLAADATYNIRIIRKCCEGLESAAAELTVNT
jgi:hypothetical protein